VEQHFPPHFSGRREQVGAGDHTPRYCTEHITSAVVRSSSSVTHRATEMTDPPPAAVNPRQKLLGTSKKGRKRTRPKGAAAVLCDLKPAQVCFQCAYAEGSGCTEGTDGSDRGYSGAYHAAGQLRGSRTFDYSHWEQYCPTHWRLIMGNSESSSVQSSAAAAAAAAAGTGGASTSGATLPPPVSGAASSASTAATAVARTTTGAGARHNGDGALADLALWPSASFPDPSGKAIQLQRLSQLYFDGKPTPTNSDADAPPSLEPRVQRHENLPEKEVTAAVKAVVLQLRDGMPMPGEGGGLNPPKKWKGIWKERSEWPGACIDLGDPAVRARGCKRGEEWTAASKQLARKHHLVTGKVVLLLPEVK